MGLMEVDHIKRLITLTSDNIKRLSLYKICSKYQWGGGWLRVLWQFFINNYSKLKDVIYKQTFYSQIIKIRYFESRHHLTEYGVGFQTKFQIYLFGYDSCLKPMSFVCDKLLSRNVIFLHFNLEKWIMK